MPDIPRATLAYKPENQPGKKILRSAKCPLHNKPGTYRGEQPDMSGKKFWAFACPYLGPRKAHIFVAQPPSNSPETAEALAQWIQSEELKKVLGTPGRSNS